MISDAPLSYPPAGTRSIRERKAEAKTGEGDVRETALRIEPATPMAGTRRLPDPGFVCLPKCASIIEGADGTTVVKYVCFSISAFPTPG
jgi:hypothetical protein